MELRDCVVVVTGGASGLGEAAVRVLVDRGAKASILDVNVERGERLVSEFGDTVIFCETDVTNEASVQSAIANTISAFGAIHVAVNCAGVSPAEKVIGKRGVMSLESFNAVIQLNLVGTMNVIRLSAAEMIKNIGNDDGEKGVVVNTASIAAFDGQIGQAAYSASKAGVAGMTLPIAREFAGYGIRNVTIAPGLFLTPLAESLPQKVVAALAASVPFPKRLGKPSEFAHLVRHIIENPMFNGTTIRLDGALRMGDG